MITRKTVRDYMARMNKRWGLKLTMEWQAGFGGRIYWANERPLSCRANSSSLSYFLDGIHELMFLIEDGMFTYKPTED